MLSSHVLRSFCLDEPRIFGLLGFAG